uniref:Uncharacterized protein n=1 Tax=Corethron hystrix TaxID=216773 RepID=A0A6U5H539_9STRA|mmetsp:Transcript_29200/g.66998  ORF Transcript_29200/g.66998 Transcript_29200/m.66998 type:complete len:296 (+) Transcript_29200:1082-1969(+)
MLCTFRSNELGWIRDAKKILKGQSKTTAIDRSIDKSNTFRGRRNDKYCFNETEVNKTDISHGQSGEECAMIQTQSIDQRSDNENCSVAVSDIIMHINESISDMVDSNNEEDEIDRIKREFKVVQSADNEFAKIPDEKQKKIQIQREKVESLLQSITCIEKQINRKAEIERKERLSRIGQYALSGWVLKGKRCSKCSGTVMTHPLLHRDDCIDCKSSTAHGQSDFANNTKNDVHDRGYLHPAYLEDAQKSLTSLLSSISHCESLSPDRRKGSYNIALSNLNHCVKQVEHLVKVQWK